MNFSRIINNQLFDWDSKATMEESAHNLRLVDVAQGLHALIRFNGTSILSEAQRNIILSHIVPEKYAKYALFHSCEKIIIGDIPAPILRVMFELSPAFQTLVDNIRKALLTRFDIYPNNMAVMAVKEAARTVLLLENYFMLYEALDLYAMPPDTKHKLTDISAYCKFFNDALELSVVPASFMERAKELGVNDEL